MKKTISILSKNIYAAVLVLSLLCLTFSCHPHAEEGLTDEEVQTLIDGVLEIYNEGNLDMADTVMTPDFIQRSTALDNAEDVTGIEEYKEYITTVRTQYADFNAIVEETITSGDRVVVVWNVTWTNIDPTGVSPFAGQMIQLDGVDICRVVDGKIAEILRYANEAQVYAQLGFTFTPPMAQSEQ